MSSKPRKRREAPGPFTVAGLVRFYEEADVGIRIKPHIVIAIAVSLVIVVIVLQKILPLT